MTGKEALTLTRGNKRLALFVLMRVFGVPGLDASGYPAFHLLTYGDWMIRLDNGTAHVVTDEQFRAQFRLIEKPEGKSCDGKKR